MMRRSMPSVTRSLSISSQRKVRTLALCSIAHASCPFKQSRREKRCRPGRHLRGDMLPHESLVAEARGGGGGSEGGLATLARADANHVVEGGDEDFPVAELAGARRAGDGADDELFDVVGDDDF